MDKFDRFQQIHRIFRSRKRGVSLRVLAEKLECSEKTAKRNIDAMIDVLGAPIEYARDRGGWFYNDQHEQLFELPGLWLTAQELQSLALLLQLLDQFGSGLLNDELHTIDRQIDRLLRARGIERAQFEKIIRVLPLTTRHVPSSLFSQIAQATLAKKRVKLRYRDYNNNNSVRSVSPLHLVYYRENWYLDAWCHLRNDLRVFSLARVEHVLHEKQAAKAIPPTQLHERLMSGYGIFTGRGSHKARLRFLPAVAREIAMQQWHPEQQAEWEGNDYLLTLPYADDKELIQDILRFTPHVVVEAPATLKKRVKTKLQQGLENYLDKGLGWL